MFLKSCKNFSKKNHLFFQKTQNFERLETSGAVVKIETHFDKKTCKIRRFRKFSLGFFLKKFISFFQKNPKSDFFENSRGIGTFGRPSKRSLPCFLFLKTCEDFFDHSNFFAKKKHFWMFFWARLSNITIRYAFYEIFPRIIDFQKAQDFFRKKAIFFSKNPRFEHLGDS